MEDLRVENTEFDKDRLLFEDVKNFGKELEKKSQKSRKKSTILGIVNGIMNLSIIALSAVIIGITSYYNLQNIGTIVLGGVIFLFSSLNTILGLNAKGFNYKKSSIRYKEMSNDIKNLLYSFSEYNRKQVMYILDFFRKQVSNIELEIYGKSLIGEVSFGQDIRVANPQLGNTDSPVYRRRSALNDDDKSLIMELSRSSRHSSIEFFEDPFGSPKHHKNSFHSKNNDSIERSTSVVESKLYKSEKNILNRTMSLPNLKIYNVQKE